MITIYSDQPVGPLRPLHGVNRGPVDRNWYFDLRPWFQRWQVPSVRTHDCIYNAFDTVDLHYLFPDPDADPEDPGSYAFGLSDDLLAAIRDTGAEIYFRLGETIEHQPRMTWNRPERWKPEVLARVCVNIVRHYNEGWANGFHWGIRHWEFWNEPDGPKNWTGSVEEFYELYSAVACAIKAHDPSLKVGTAGFGYLFLSRDETITKWGSMLKRCVDKGVPVDFVSWHRYLVSWNDAVLYANRVRRLLDEIGLEKAESHLGEWSPLALLNAKERPVTVFESRNMKRYDLMRRIGAAQQGARAAAVIFGTLAALQDAPVEIAQYYCADTSSLFGLFDSYGLPAKRGWAFEAFSEFVLSGEAPMRLAVEGNTHSVIALATREGDSLRLGIASTEEQIDLPVQILSATGEQWEIKRARVLDETSDLMEVPVPPAQGDGVIALPLSTPGVVLAEFVPVGRAVNGKSRQAAAIPVGEWAARDGDW